MSAVFRVQCPPGFRRGCSCGVVATEPSDDCHVHGLPDPRFCAYCNQIVASAPGATCKRCGWRRPEAAS